jgi:hypothetical protein
LSNMASHVPMTRSKPTISGGHGMLNEELG